MARKLIAVILLLAVFLVGVPLAAGLILGEGKAGDEADGGEGEDFAGKLKTPQTITVWLTDEERAQELDFEEYVACVTASEMPADFDEEALKAQSVAARTYAMAKLSKYADAKPASHPEAALCDTTHCQVYKDEAELIAIHEAGWEESGLAKIKKACAATTGELLYYQGELVSQPLFFSSSGGQTENSEDVFSGAYPYLVSVSSPYEEQATHQNEEKSFSLTELAARLAAAYPEKSVGELSAENIKILDHTQGGRVSEIKIGSAVFAGTQVRSALGLSSTLFTISFSADGTMITFTSNGSGHGVGMSQYGAHGMALAGSDYRQILTHYYSGTEVH